MCWIPIERATYISRRRHEVIRRPRLPTHFYTPHNSNKKNYKCHAFRSVDVKGRAEGHAIRFDASPCSAMRLISCAGTDVTPSRQQTGSIQQHTRPPILHTLREYSLRSAANLSADRWRIFWWQPQPPYVNIRAHGTFKTRPNFTPKC
jgi:hypothetical protein